MLVSESAERRASLKINRKQLCLLFDPREISAYNWLNSPPASQFELFIIREKLKWKTNRFTDFNLIYVSTFRDGGETIITNSFSLRYKHIEMFWGSTRDINKSVMFIVVVKRLPDASADSTS